MNWHLKNRTQQNMGEPWKGICVRDLPSISRVPQSSLEDPPCFVFMFNCIVFCYSWCLCPSACGVVMRHIKSESQSCTVLRWSLCSYAAFHLRTCKCSTRAGWLLDTEWSRGSQGVDPMDLHHRMALQSVIVEVLFEKNEFHGTRRYDYEQCDWGCFWDTDMDKNKTAVNSSLCLLD